MIVSLRSFLVMTVAVAAIALPHLPAVAGETGDASLDLTFPDVEGWTRQQRQIYPQPGGGYSVNYNSKDAVKVTFYVYNGQRDTVPQDLSSPILKGEIEDAAAAIHQATSLGYYRSAERKKRGVRPIGTGKAAPTALYQQFRIVQKDGTKTRSELYLAAYKDHFIKIRCTQPARKDPARQKSLDRLFTALAKLVSD